MCQRLALGSPFVWSFCNTPEPSLENTTISLGALRCLLSPFEFLLKLVGDRVTPTTARPQPYRREGQALREERQQQLDPLVEPTNCKNRQENPMVQAWLQFLYANVISHAISPLPSLAGQFWQCSDLLVFIVQGGVGERMGWVLRLAKCSVAPHWAGWALQPPRLTAIHPFLCISSTFRAFFCRCWYI